MTRWISFQRLKAEVSIAEVLAHYGLLANFRQRGDELLGLCPFHQEQDGSFRASLTKNVFQCFGCHRHGDVLDFVAFKEQVSLRQAGLILHGWFAPSEVRQPLAQKSPPLGEGPLPPGLHPRVEENLPLGFALRQLDPQCPYLAARGLTPATLRTFGLGRCSHGLLAGRIAIPIHDAQGRLVAYAGRWPGSPPQGEPRYRFPANFHKSRVLFNLHRARGLAKTRGLVLVEGFFGCFRLHQAGYPNVCALMGSALTLRQRELLVEALGPHGTVTLWFDADPAGRRCLDQCQQALSTQVHVKAVRFPCEGVQPDQLPESEIRRILA